MSSRAADVRGEAETKPVARDSPMGSSDDPVKLRARLMSEDIMADSSMTDARKRQADEDPEALQSRVQPAVTSMETEGSGAMKGLRRSSSKAELDETMKMLNVYIKTLNSLEEWAAAGYGVL